METRATNGPSKELTALSDQVAQQAAMIRALQKRFEEADDEERRRSVDTQSSEGSATRGKGRPIMYTTYALGLEMVRRLKRGEKLEAKISRELSLALEALVDGSGSAAPGVRRDRMMETPLTDEDGTRRHGNQDLVNDDDDDEPPRKRSRFQRPPGAEKTDPPKGKPKSLATPQKRATPRRRSRSRNSSNDLRDDVEMEDFDIPPEVRRSGREPKPARLQDNMLPWTHKEVQKQMREMKHDS